MRKIEIKAAILCPLLIVVLAPTSCPAEQSLSVTYTNLKDGFTISFPSGWAPMDPAKLEGLNKTAEIQHPGWKRPLLHYGYQTTNSTGLPFAPSVIIRVTEVATPDPKAVEAELEKGEDLPQPVQSIQREKVAFDPELNFLAQTNRIQIAGAPPFGACVAFFLTKESIIKMFFYAPLAENGGPNVPISEIIRSVQIEADKRLAPSTPPSRAGLILGILSMAIVVLVLFRAKPRGAAGT